MYTQDPVAGIGAFKQFIVPALSMLAVLGIFTFAFFANDNYQPSAALMHASVVPALIIGSLSCYFLGATFNAMATNRYPPPMRQIVSYASAFAIGALLCWLAFYFYGDSENRKIGKTIYSDFTVSTMQVISRKGGRCYEITFKSENTRQLICVTPKKYNTLHIGDKQQIKLVYSWYGASAQLWSANTR